MDKRTVILDTDIGSDIDDAVCLAYLLMQPRCELMGVTTVSGEADLRARMCSAIVKAAGKDVPIYPGVEVPLLTPVRQPKCQQAAMLGNWPHETEFPRNRAVDFLRDSILTNPGKIDLLAIGPMTNVGLLFATYPETAQKLRSLTLMCGRFGNAIPRMPHCEWNALNDPYATAVVYNAPVKTHRSIGLDVTMQVRMDAKQVAARFTHPVLRPVYDFSKVWFERADVMTFHDPLAAATLFDEAICGFERGEAKVELASEPLWGLTHWCKDENGPHEAALTVCPETYFEHFFSLFS